MPARRCLVAVSEWARSAPARKPSPNSVPNAHFDCFARFARSARIAPLDSPTSLSLADDKCLCSLRLSTARARSFYCRSKFACALVSPSGAYVKTDFGIDQRLLGCGNAIDDQLSIHGCRALDQS
jgi:hypothetical protein